MNVLAVLGGPQNISKVMQFWKPYLNNQDQLLILTSAGTDPTQDRDHHFHELEQILFSTEYRRWPKKFLEVTFNGARMVRSRFQEMSNAYCQLLWKVVLSYHYHDFVRDLRSFDPDLIDLRWMPQSAVLEGKLTEELPWITTLSSNRPFRRSSVDASWRSYDPRLRVSIVIPVYNGAKYLRQSIESCLRQTHQNIELVVVDDCSTDKTPDIISEYAKQDSRINSIRNSSNLRLAGALNVGFQNATGQLLSWTSHDNYYAPNAIETLVRQFCSLPQVGLVYSAFHHIDEQGRVDPRIVYLPPPCVLSFYVNSVGPCFMYRKAVYEKIGDYDENMEFEEDYEYWVRVFRSFKMMRLHIPLYYYRRHRESMTAARRRDHRFERKVGRQT